MSWVRRLMVRVLQYSSSRAVFRIFGSGGVGHLLSLGVLVFVGSFHFAMDVVGFEAVVALVMVITATVLLISL